MRSILLLFGCLILAVAGSAGAREDGITGLSTSGCDDCHSGAPVPTVSIVGPSSVTVGDTASYMLTVTGGAGVVCGLDVSATLGSLMAVDAGTRLESAEIVHDVPRAFSSGSCSFSFDWTAPDVAGSPTASLFGAGNSANGNGNITGDQAATTSLAVSVTGGATASISANPSLVSVGSDTTLTWSTTNATGCEAFGAWSGMKSAGNGLSEVVTPAEGPNVYGLSCFGSIGSATAQTQTVVTGIESLPSFPITTVDLGAGATPFRISTGGSDTLYVNVRIPIPGARSAIGNLIIPDPTATIIRAIAPDGGTTDVGEILSSGFAIVASAGGDVYSMHTEMAGFSTNSHISRLEPDGTFTRVTSTLFAQGLLPFSAGEYTLDEDDNIFWVVLTYAAATRDGRTILKVTPEGIGQVVLEESDGLSSPVDVAVDSEGGVYVAESFLDRLVYRSPTGDVSFLVTATGDGDEALLRPSSVAVDAFGNAYVAGGDSDNVFRVSPAGAVSVALSKTQVGSAVFDNPYDMETDAHGNLYVLARDSRSAWRVRPDGGRDFLIDSSGDGVTSMAAPVDLTVDDAGNVFISDGNVVFQIATPVSEASSLFQAAAAFATLAALGARRKRRR